MDTSVVDTPDLSGLIELSRDPQLDLKPVILRVQTDLFLAAPFHDRAELEAFESLSTGLIPTVDNETATVVAQKLAPLDATPLGVLEALAARGGECGMIVLVSIAKLTPPILDAALKAGVDLKVAIERRAARSRARAADSEAAERAIVQDQDARIDRSTLERLIARARAEPALAAELFERKDIAPRDLAPLWLHAEIHQRAAIQDALAATSALRPIPPGSRDLGQTLIALSNERDVRGFATVLAAELGLSANFLTSIPDPAARYELLTLALRAADLREEEAVHVFLTLSDPVARSVERVFALVALFRATTRPIARELLAAILNVALTERAGTAEHQSYYGEDAARPRTSIAERSVQRIAQPNRLRRKG